MNLELVLLAKYQPIYHGQFLQYVHAWSAAAELSVDAIFEN